MASAKDWIDAARPKTLGAAIAPVLVGTVIGWRFGGQWHPWLAACTLLSCIALQVATNWFNDAIDFVKGSDTAERLGPRRITASGVVTAKQVLTAACWMLAIAAALSVPLILARGWPIVAIGIPSLYFCYGYTGGPAPLAYRGLGELFVILFFGLVAVTGSAFVQSGQWHFEALIAGFQIGCLSTVLIAINNLRDVPEDTKSGKKTLAVRFGTTFAKWEITGLIVVALGLNAYWWSLGATNILGRHPVMFVIGIWIVVRVWLQSPEHSWNKLLAVSGLYLLVSAISLVSVIDRIVVRH
ncbi:MAG: 1,4-dihydroxy-2-naphthoate octaprenyltransferase [Verrucomicrobiaceae bacterium]|nr:1,4-dihydroxy-2-naphthoate octaprenyltransferase [Verrucomicrobiaceae bacterium]